MPGPGPVPGETLKIFDGSAVYWNLVPPNQNEPIPTLIFTAVNGTIVKINRQTGAIIS
jgi:hypothetical protein